MRKIGWFFVFLLMTNLMAMPARAQELPDIFIQNNNGFGGLGRLAYNGHNYTLADGLFTPYIIDNVNELERAIKNGSMTAQQAQAAIDGQGPQSIRAMRVDEGGGSMAVPSALAAISGAVFAMISPYNTILKLGSNAEIIQRTGFAEFKFQGSPDRAMQILNGNLFFTMNDGTIIALDSNLQQLSTVKPQNMGWNNKGAIISGSKLYVVNAADTGMVMQCEGPGGCGQRYISVVVVDIAHARNMRIESDDKVAVENLSAYVPFQGIDSARNGLLLVNGSFNDSTQLDWRLLDKPADIVAELSVAGKVVALTQSAPFYTVIQNADALSLSAVTSDSNGLKLGEALPLNLKPDHAVVLRQQGDLLYVMSGNQLRIVNVAHASTMILSQDFAGSTGAQFDVKDFVPVSGMAAVSTQADKARIMALLALDYLDDAKKMELENQLNKLTPQDDWALPILTEALAMKNSSAWVMRQLAISGLAHMGPTAVPAIPALLNVAMEGAAINGETTPRIIAALQNIDPQGMAVIGLLPDFIKNHYEAGAKMVARDILSALKGQAAVDALKLYQ